MALGHDIKATFILVQWFSTCVPWKALKCSSLFHEKFSVAPKKFLVCCGKFSVFRKIISSVPHNFKKNVWIFYDFEVFCSIDFVPNKLFKAS